MKRQATGREKMFVITNPQRARISNKELLSFNKNTNDTIF